MLKVQGRADTKRGGIITAVAERAVWDVVLDDDGDEAVANLVSASTITVVSTDETATDTWTVVLSDDAATTVTGLTKTGAVGIASSTEDAGEDSGIWDITLDAKGYISGLDLEAVVPVVAGWMLYDINGPVGGSTNFTPVWEYVSAVEFAKYLVVQGG